MCPLQAETLQRARRSLLVAGKEFKPGADA
jgi:hypothetical protein